jgi:hypothetical protein
LISTALLESKSEGRYQVQERCLCHLNFDY